MKRSTSLPKLIDTCHVTLIALVMTLIAVPEVSAQSVAWVRQFVASGDVGYGVAAGPAGSVYLTGITLGNLDGAHGGVWENFGDAFLTKTDSTGWNYGSRQLGTTFQEISHGVAADSLGNIFIAGTTEGSMFGSFQGGVLDGFFAKFDANSGATVVSQQVGSSNWDECRGVAADGLGNGYAVGFTEGVLGASNFGGRDAFVLKSAASGPGWTQQFGTNGADEGLAIAADALGNIYVAGNTTGNLDGNNAGGRDAFVTRYSSAGNLVWSKQLGTGTDDEALAAATDGLGNVYIAGYSTGDLGGVNAGGRDAFVSKFDVSGSIVWTRRLGSSADDEATGVAVDGLGNVFISGHSTGSLEGNNAGGSDAFVSKLSGTGELRWTEQFGTASNDKALGVAADDQRNVYLSGETLGNMQILSSDFQGNDGDAFLIKFVDPNIPGDFNGDNMVDAADYVVLRKGLGTTCMQNDFNTWQANFGATLGSGAGFSGLNHAISPIVPEPATVLLLVCWVMVMCLPARQFRAELQ
jgi:hypothetical protein